MIIISRLLLIYHIYFIPEKEIKPERQSSWISVQTIPFTPEHLNELKISSFPSFLMLPLYISHFSWCWLASCQWRSMWMFHVADLNITHTHTHTLQECMCVFRMMYWSVVGDRSHIEESAMDGSLRRVLLEKNLRRPTGVCLYFCSVLTHTSLNKCHCSVELNKH